MVIIILLLDSLPKKLNCRECDYMFLRTFEDEKKGIVYV